MVSVLGSCLANFRGVRDCVGGLERGDDSLIAAEAHERVDALFVRGGDVLDALDVLEVAVLRAHAGVVQPGRARVFAARARPSHPAASDT